MDYLEGEFEAPLGDSEFRQRADAEHARFESSQARAAFKHYPGPSEQLGTAGIHPHIVEMLQFMDDLVFEAIGGSDSALSQIEVLWPTLSLELSSEQHEAYREEYLRYALRTWSDSCAGEVSLPPKAAAALDVLCLLLEDA